MTTLTSTLIHLDPAALVAHPANVRDDLGDLAELTASIRQFGVLEPLLVIPTADGHRILAGHRRAAAAIAAGGDPVPCYERPDLADDVIQIAAQLVENLRRADLTPVEEAKGYQMLLDLGMSEARIATATGTKRDRVSTALAVAKSEAATTAARNHNLTLDQALVLAEFDGDDEAIEALHTILDEEPEYIDHAAAELRQAREREATRIRVIEDHRAAGVTVLADAPAGYVSQSLTEPRLLEALWDQDDEAIDPNQHTTCPGHAVWITTDWRGDAHVRPACTNPGQYGHRNRWRGHDSGTAASTKTNEEASAERREVIANNKAWHAAEPVRRDHIRALLARPKVPAGTLRYVTEEVMHHPGSINHGTDQLAADLTGTDPGEWGWAGTAPRAIVDKAGDSRLALVLLIRVAAAREQSMDVHTWRRRSPEEARWLTYLASTGYQLSKIEQRVVDEAAASPGHGDDEVLVEANDPL